MAQKMMAFDLDGTLIFDLEISRADQEAIHAWQEAGNLAVCATGKSISATRYALKDTDLRFDYYVLYTGAVVTDADFQILSSSTLPRDLVQDIVGRTVRQPGVATYGTTLDTRDVCFASNTASAGSSVLADFTHLDPEQIPEHEFVGIPLRVEGDEQQDLEERIGQIQAWVRWTFGDVVDCHRNQMFLDIVPAGCTKATGLVWLDEQHLRGQYIPYSLGDSWNDLPMHAWALHSASFQHSPREVQEATETVVGSAAEYITAVLGE